MKTKSLYPIVDLLSLPFNHQVEELFLRHFLLRLNPTTKIAFCHIKVSDGVWYQVLDRESNYSSFYLAA